MELNDLLKKVRHIEIKSKDLSDRVFTGGYHSAFKGKGMAFAEVREYQWGDDVRNLDWNVTARYDTPFVKVYEEERELPVMLLLDVSPSTLFATQLSHSQEAQSKKEILAELCALLAFSALNNGDKVGIIFFADKVLKIIPPNSGRNHVLKIIREIIEVEPSGQKTQLGQALSVAHNVMKSHAIIFLLSDFWDDGPDYKDALGILKRKHDVVGLHLFDKAEYELPEGLLFLASDLETGKQMWIDSSDKQFRNAYKQRFVNNMLQHKSRFDKVGADFASIDLQASYTTALMRLFRQREKKRN